MEPNKETSFERMKKAVCEIVKEELEVEVTSCKSHTSCTLKLVTNPDAANAVEVYIPYQIFVAAKANELCKEWDVNLWKIALRQLYFEMGHKNCTKTRLMPKKHANISKIIENLEQYKRNEVVNAFKVMGLKFCR